MSSFRILSLDGGGIRGILTAAILERLEKAHPGFLAQVDLFAGTSTGGILALGIAAGFNPTRAVELYQTAGKVVFRDNWLDDLRDLGNLTGAEYSLENLQVELEKQFGSRTLAELEKHVLISAFDLDSQPAEKWLSPPPQPRSWKAKFFHNFPGPGSDGGEFVVDVALRTAAAPTYFPIYQGYVDGGVVAGNPSMCALTQALHTSAGARALPDLVLFSLGTGENPRHLESQDGDWGLAQWVPHLVSLMLEGSAGLVDYQCRQILDDRYWRLNPVLPRPIEMDQSDQIPLLLEVARNCDLSSTLEWLRLFFD